MLVDKSSLQLAVCSLQMSKTAFQPQLSGTEWFKFTIKVSTAEQTHTIDVTLLIPLTICTSLRSEKQNNTNNKSTVHGESLSLCLLTRI